MLDSLYRSALVIDEHSRPLVSIRLMSGQSEVRVRGRGGALLLRPRAEAGQAARTIRAPEGATLRLVASRHQAGGVRRFPIVADLPAGSAAEQEVLKAVRDWSSRGHRVRIENVGSVFGLGGRVVDNRRVLVVLDGPGDDRSAAAALEAAAAELQQTPVLHEIRVSRPSTTVTILDEGGAVLASARDHVFISASAGGSVEVLGVEYGVGYAWQGRENRRYEGELHVVPDDRSLSLVNVLALESLLRGVVPAETYASAHIEALKAQAVTARTDILAKIGTRHLADPALICAETHCQVYKGVGAVARSTDEAIRLTEGQVLVTPEGRLVNAVYSAMCGGHTESNDVVWGTPPDPSLRGRLDLPAEGEWLRFAAGIGEDDLSVWLAEAPPSWCRLASMGASSRFRWTRAIPAGEMDQRVEHLGVGSVRDIEVLGRGVSGRVRAVRISGTRGSAVIRRELPVRRLFSNLESGMFEVSVERRGDVPTAFVFRGGGWGHGVGMCQTGAIGMAEHGHDHRSILRHYYNGASVASLY